MTYEVDRLLDSSRVIRRADARLACMSDAALRAARQDGRLARQLRGIDLTAPAGRTHDGRFHALQAVAPQAALSGPSVARWHRWEVPAAWPDELTVAPGSRRPRQRRGLRIVTRQLERGVAERYGIRGTDPARTIAELLRGADAVPQLWLLDQALRSGVRREAVICLLPARGPGSGARARQLLALGDAAASRRSSRRSRWLWRGADCPPPSDSSSSTTPTAGSSPASTSRGRLVAVVRAALAPRT